MNDDKFGQWIPVESRPMTKKEYQEFIEKSHGEYCAADYPFEEARCFTSQMPYDGQEILVSYGDIVDTDIACEDPETGEIWLENNDIENIDAWMPIPEPYKPSAPSRYQL